MNAIKLPQIVQMFGKKNKEKKAGKKSGDFDTSHFRPILNVSLKQALINGRSYDGVPIPAVVRQCIDYVEEQGLQSEGIYRVSSPMTRLDEIEKMANHGASINFIDPHEAAGLLKRFLRQLPEHILTEPLKKEFEYCASLCKCDPYSFCVCNVVNQFKQLLQSLPNENYYLLAYVFLHAQHVVYYHHENKMNIAALGVLLQAMLNISRNVVRIFLLNASNKLKPDNKNIVYLFDDVRIKRYVPPMTIEELKKNIPESSTAIQEEIVKQENLLEHLHNTVLAMRNEKRDIKAKEQEIWDVQTGITMLKRKLKTVAPDEPQPVDASYDVSENSSDEKSDYVVPGPFLEKQLLAIQSALKEEIAEEQRKIVMLYLRLQELNIDYTPRLTESQHIDALVEECLEQEKVRDTLCEEIVRLRDETAQLRARLEQGTMAKNTSQESQSAELQDGVVLVTKF